MNIEFLNPPELCPTFGWTHVVASRGGKTIHISGQVGIDAAGKVVGVGDLKAQTEQAFKNIRAALGMARESVKYAPRRVTTTSLMKPEPATS